MYLCTFACFYAAVIICIGISYFYTFSFFLFSSVSVQYAIISKLVLLCFIFSFKLFSWSRVSLYRFTRVSGCTWLTDTMFSLITCFPVSLHTCIGLYLTLRYQMLFDTVAHKGSITLAESSFLADKARSVIACYTASDVTPKVQVSILHLLY